MKSHTRRKYIEKVIKDYLGWSHLGKLDADPEHDMSEVKVYRDVTTNAMVPMEMNPFAERQNVLAAERNEPPPYREDVLQRALNAALAPRKKQGEEPTPDGVMMYLRNCQMMAVEAGSAQICGFSTQTFRIQLLKRTQDGGRVAVTQPEQEVDEIVIEIKLAEELKVTIDAKKVAAGEDLVTAIKASTEGVGLGAHVAVDKMFKKNGLMLNLSLIHI